MCNHIFNWCCDLLYLDCHWELEPECVWVVVVTLECENGLNVGAKCRVDQLKATCLGVFVLMGNVVLYCLQNTYQILDRLERFPLRFQLSSTHVQESESSL